MKNPIIIIGAERSGTTLLYSLLSNHSAFYWFSQLDSIFPKLPRLTTYIRCFYSMLYKQNYISKIGRISKSSGFNTPSECLPYWKSVFHFGTENNYQIEDDYFDEEDCTDTNKESILIDMNIRLSILSKDRLLLKQPGFSLKIKYFDALFENPKYIIVFRDLNDNLISLVNAKNNSKEKLWGTKIPGWKSLIKSSFIEQSVQQISCCYNIIVNDLSTLNCSKSRYIFINYDELVKNPSAVMSNVIKFCDLKYEPIYETSSSLYNDISNRKTNQIIELTKNQETILENTKTLIINAHS